jgi:predicted CoA-binding protein
MASDHQSFWSFDRYAVVGNSARKPFPRLTYGELAKRGKTAYAVDPSTDRVEGKPAYRDFAALPASVEAAVLELPRDETAAWVKRAVEAGIREIWIHQGADTPEAIAIAQQAGVRLRTGTCAVMYLNRGLSPHGIHRAINKLIGKY